MGHLGFFQLIKNYSETILLFDEEDISQEASYTAQQSSSKVKSPKTCMSKYFCLICKRCDFSYIKPKVLA